MSDSFSNSIAPLPKLSNDSFNDTLISLNDYINKALPLHLQKLLLDNLQHYQEEFLDSVFTNIFTRQRHLPSFPRSYGSSFSSWSFAQGLIVGQLSILIVLIFFIKFFVFSEGSSKNDSTGTPSSTSTSASFFMTPPLVLSTTNRIFSILRRNGRDNHDSSIDAGTLETKQSRQINSILEKTYYNVDTHPSESLDWFNVLIAQTIHQFREEALQKDNIVHSLNDFIQRKSNELPEYLDSIKITELDIGKDFPIFSNCRIQYSPNSNKKRLEAKIDIDLSDRLALGISTKLLMNYPKPFTAALPIQLTVSIVRFQACLTVSFASAEEFVSTSTVAQRNDDTETEHGHYLMFSFSPEYRMEFDIHSLIGARSKLESIPKIGSLIESQIKKWFAERCVEPRFQFIKLPSIWPRSKNTREEKPDTDDLSMQSNDCNS